MWLETVIARGARTSEAGLGPLVLGLWSWALVLDSLGKDQKPKTQGQRPKTNPTWRRFNFPVDTMIESPAQVDKAATEKIKKSIPLRRRLVYAGVIYAIFLVLLAVVEVVTRLTLPHLSSLDLFVVTTQQKMQIANSKQAGIFEGDPLLLWRLKPDLVHTLFDLTPGCTNSQYILSEQPL